MPKIIYIEPTGYHTPLLFDTFKETFALNGHGETNNLEEADLAFVDVYSYQQMVSYLPIDKPLVYFDFSDYGGMSKESYPDWLRFGNSKAIYFVRKMDKERQYPPFVYPIEHIIEYDFPNVTKENLYDREYDFCFIGNESPQRKSVVNGLLEAGLKGYVHWTNEKGKIPHNEWIEKHRNAKMFLSADGGGFSDERIYQLGTVSVILKQKNNQLQVHPFIHGYDCREVSEVPTEYEIEHLKKFLSTPRAMYAIYLLGTIKLRRDYSAKARSNYILSILKQNGL